jgi:DNA polymerase-3 subunit epsilon
MFTHLSLRLRIFLFFALLALGGAALLTAGLVIGYIRLGEDHALSAFITAGAVGGICNYRPVCLGLDEVR